VITVIPMFLIFKQPDLGTALLLFGIFFVMIFTTTLEANDNYADNFNTHFLS